MKGSVAKYVITGSKRPRWRYRIDAGLDRMASASEKVKAASLKSLKPATP